MKRINESDLNNRLVIVVLEGHEYIYDIYGWKFLIHNENCPCKISKKKKV